MNDTHIYVLYTCDQWKSRSSMVPLMVSTKFERVLEQLRKELAREGGSMINTRPEGEGEVVVDTTEKAVDQINRFLQYGHIEIWNDGEVRDQQ